MKYKLFDRIKVVARDINLTGVFIGRHSNIDRYLICLGVGGDVYGWGIRYLADQPRLRNICRSFGYTDKLYWVDLDEIRRL